ncbi:FRG domain-containing protein [Pasteurella multocida]|uniref:FRG domain-containing protein n=1 Tax=Pasteurella multocida TaxID=747 RepID=UPI000D349BA9|nr:FRG domain-containing protein [Pasteurella multocida]AWB52923.1 FRG domain-containing protein [Pasteurella multocida]HDR1803826.1 FRG domain-containing protein [Pasteurella multocida]
MNERKKKVDDFYNKIYATYKPSDYFDEIEIVINYYMDITRKNGRPYKILSLSLDKQSSQQNNIEKVKSFIHNFNERLSSNSSTENWQLFYLYKELLQFFVHSNDKYNYFRGQSHSYSLTPNILRDNVQYSYRDEFENLYLKISHEFPEKITYFNLQNCDIEDREYQLSLLQHYGLKTSLLDITSNPYIAMLFMLSESFDSYKEPTFFLFKINENIHRDKHLFTEVRKSKLNERIVAQKGAFLNFDKIFMNKHFDVEKISSVKVKLNFSDDEYLKYLENEMENIKKIQMENNDASDPKELEEQSNYLALLEREKNNITESKKQCLKAIKDELSQKLREYCYFEEDLFPDFETRIKYLSRKYDSSTHKKISF